jgi:hypothetical membrane protein
VSATSHRAALWCGVAGPAAFVAAWAVGGLASAGYSPVRSAISQLAREGAPTRALMTAGFLAFGLLVPVYAGPLGARLGRPVQAAVTVSGLATLAVAALPLSRATGQPVDAWHAVAAGTGYVAQAVAPLLGGRRLGPGAARTASYAVSAVAALCLVASVLQGGATGLLQRTGLTAVDLWYAVVALHLLRTVDPVRPGPGSAAAVSPAAGPSRGRR